MSQTESEASVELQQSPIPRKAKVKQDKASAIPIKTEAPVKSDEPQPQKSPIPRKARLEAASATPVEQEEGVTGIKQQDASPTTNGLPFIPCISAPSDPRTTETTTVSTLTRQGIPGPTVGLPEGVTVPLAVDTTLLQGRLLETLKQLPVDLINDALVEYSDALGNKGDSIRNKGAYLFGVLKRYAQVQERAASGQFEGVMGQTLTPAVQERLERLVMGGFCTQEEMNDKVKSKIRMLSEKDALFAIDELSSVERGQIRSFASYFMGILNRYMRGEKAPGQGEARRKPRQQDTYGRNDRKYDDRQRGRSPDGEYRRRDDDRRSGGDHDNRSTRERSRDRHDDDRGRNRRNDSRSRQNDLFRSQPQPPPPQQHLPPQQQYQQGQYGGYALPPPHRQGMPPMNAYAPQPQQQQQQQQVYMQPNQLFQQQQPPPQHYIPQQGSVPLGIPGSSFVPQQTMGSQQPLQMGQPYVGTMQLQQQHPPLMGNQLQQSLVRPNVSYDAPAPGAWQSQSMPSTNTIPADILGLADKAASAVQLLQASRSLSQPPVVNNMHHQMQMPNRPNSFSSYSNPVQSSQPPTSRRGRTTATMNELPVTVQYAVQNLQATGYVDGTLDEGILGMIKDLPEPIALQALQKFSSIDTNQMRNKTAYLAGVLRRELETIQRR